MSNFIGIKTNTKCPISPGIGVGAQIPIYSDYAGKVAIYLIGIGTPSVGGGIGNSESVDDKKAKIERDIQDNLYGLD